MNITRRPVAVTIVFGLVCGLLFIPISTAFSFFIYRPIALSLTIWGYFALYGIFLARWGKVSVSSIVFPLLLLLIFVYWRSSNIAFLFLALGILSWIRSGICNRGSLFKILCGELAISFGGGALVANFTPHSALDWAIGIWLFFLVQSLYFVFFKNIFEEEGEKEEDPFELARRRAEKILSTGLH